MDAEEGRPELSEPPWKARRRNTRAILLQASLSSVLFLLFTYLAHFQLLSLLSLLAPTVARSPPEDFSGDNPLKTELLYAVAVRVPCTSLLSAFAFAYAASSDRSKDAGDVVGAARRRRKWPARWESLLLLWFYHSITLGSLVLLLFLFHMELAGSASGMLFFLPVIMLVMLVFMSYLAGFTLEAAAAAEDYSSVKKSKAEVKRAEGCGAAAWISLLCHGQFLAFELMWIAAGVQTRSEGFLPYSVQV